MEALVCILIIACPFERRIAETLASEICPFYQETELPENRKAQTI